MRIAKCFPLAAALAAALVAGAAVAQPARISVGIGPKVVEDMSKLGQRDVDRQIARLTEVLNRAVASDPAFDGARIDLTLVELRANRPTWEQQRREPGLDPIHSISTGGAEIEGTVTLADGRVTPVRHRWFSSNLADVRGFSTWTDADRAYSRFANKLVREL